MAEEGSSPSGNSDGRNFSTVVSLLRQAELLLSSQVDRNAATVRPSSVETSANYISTDRSLANFRSLFARYSVPPSSPAERRRPLLLSVRRTVEPSCVLTQ